MIDINKGIIPALNEELLKSAGKIYTLTQSQAIRDYALNVIRVADCLAYLDAADSFCGYWHDRMTGEYFASNRDEAKRNRNVIKVSYNEYAAKRPGWMVDNKEQTSASDINQVLEVFNSRKKLQSMLQSAIHQALSPTQ